MTNKLCLAGIVGALLVSSRQCVHAGTWSRTNPSPIAADLGTNTISIPNPAQPNVGSSGGDAHESIPTTYYWQWSPDNNNWTLDPAPTSATIHHSFALGGGPLIATVVGSASASATATFEATIPGTSATSGPFSFTASAPPNQTTSIPASSYTQSVSISVDPTGAVTLNFVVSAYGSETVSIQDLSSSASATYAGYIKTTNATLTTP